MAIQFNNGQIVNGKRINLPSSATAMDIVRASGRPADLGSRAVVRVGARGNERLKPGMSYAIQPGDKFLVGPDRVKGSGESYFGRKSDVAKALIADQVRDLSEKMFKQGNVELDEDCNWVVFDRFFLPEAWAKANPGHRTVKMMLIFPDQFPELPTNGFYLPDYVQPPAADRHFFARGYSGAFGATSEEMEAMVGAGWKWYCTHIKPGAWRPARIQRLGDWRRGDNLWDVITLCREVLTNPYGD